MQVEVRRRGAGIVYADLEDVPETPWQFPAESIFQTRQWLSASRWPGESDRYLLAPDGSALLPARLVTEPFTWANMNLVDIASGRRHGVPADERLIAQARQEAVPHLLVATAGYETRVVGRADERALYGLIDAAEEAAGVLGGPAAFAYLPPESSALSRRLEQRGYRLGVVSAAALCRLPGAGFDDYLRLLAPKARREARRERRVFARAGAELSPVSGDAIDPFLPTLVGLVANLHRSHGAQPDLDRIEAQYRRFASLFASRMTVIVARVRGLPIAAVTTFRHGDVLYCRDFGIAGGEARQAHAYFNTCYYGAVEHAYSLGLGWVSLGTSTFWAK